VRGRCDSTTVIDKELHVSGWRIAVSSIRLGPDGRPRIVREDSGPPVTATVVVDPDVDDLTLKRLTVTHGFAIGHPDR
jgi:hypothetical protein